MHKCLHAEFNKCIYLIYTTMSYSLDDNSISSHLNVEEALLTNIWPIHIRYQNKVGRYKLLCLQAYLRRIFSCLVLLLYLNAPYALRMGVQLDVCKLGLFCPPWYTNSFCTISPWLITFWNEETQFPNHFNQIKLNFHSFFLHFLVQPLSNSFVFLVAVSR